TSSEIDLLHCKLKTLCLDIQKDQKPSKGSKNGKLLIDIAKKYENSIQLGKRPLIPTAFDIQNYTMFEPGEFGPGLPDYEPSKVKNRGGDWAGVQSDIAGFSARHKAANVVLIGDIHGLDFSYDVLTSLANRGIVGKAWAEDCPDTKNTPGHTNALDSVSKTGVKTQFFNGASIKTDTEIKNGEERSYLAAFNNAYSYGRSSSKPAAIVTGLAHILRAPDKDDQNDFEAGKRRPEYMLTFNMLHERGGIALIPLPNEHFKGPIDSGHVKSFMESSEQKYDHDGIVKHYKDGKDHTLYDFMNGGSKKSTKKYFESVYNYEVSPLQQILNEGRLEDSKVVELEMNNGQKMRFLQMAVAPPFKPENALGSFKNKQNQIKSISTPFTVKRLSKLLPGSLHSVANFKLPDDLNRYKNTIVTGVNLSNFDFSGVKKWGSVRFDPQTVNTPAGYEVSPGGFIYNHAKAKKGAQNIADALNKIDGSKQLGSMNSNDMKSFLGSHHEAYGAILGNMSADLSRRCGVSKVKTNNQQSDKYYIAENLQAPREVSKQEAFVHILTQSKKAMLV
ncbi:hypothetical protein, partial [Roseibium hamelinense]